MKIDAPDQNLANDIDTIIQNTRMNRIQWGEISNTTIYIKDHTVIDDKLKHKGNIELRKCSDTERLETDRKYVLKIGEQEITSRYNPVKVFGDYLFCEDYQRTTEKR